LIAEVRDIMGELVTLHITYLEPSGKKIEGRAPRKILSALTGRESCGVMLMPISGEILGVGEGIETSLSASKIHNIPVWSMLNTSLLSKFNPPASICKLIIFADRDIGGLEAAMGLMERLQQKVHVEVKTPRKPNCNDWNDVLLK
jgi:phage/plasmid primase-like uncharacterized protein